MTVLRVAGYAGAALFTAVVLLAFAIVLGAGRLNREAGQEGQP